MIRNFLLYVFLIWATSICASSQTPKDRWVDSVFSQLDLSGKIAQLFMVPVSSHLEDNKLNELENRVKSPTIGGLLFTTGHPVKQASLTNKLQSLAKVPLLIGQDASSGPGNLLNDMPAYPVPLAQGALASDSLVFELGKQIGRELKMLGVHMNMGLNANLAGKSELMAANSTFGESENLVADRAVSLFKGMQSENILSCARYFSVSGITVLDVVKGLPVLNAYADTVRTYPFKALFKNGLQAVMPASSELPLFYEKEKSRRKNKFSGAELSSFFSGNLIRKQMDFQGLLVVDIQHMENKFRGGDAGLFAFQAGNDLMITSDYSNSSIRKIKKLVRKEKHYMPQLDSTVKKILGIKYDAGLARITPTQPENLMAKLNATKTKIFQQNIFRSAITIARNEDNTLPLLTLENKKFACITAGDTTTLFRQLVSKYVHASNYRVIEEKDAATLDSSLTKADVIIVALTPALREPVLEKIVFTLRGFIPAKEIIIADFGCAAFSKYAYEFPVIITGYSNHPEMIRALTQALFGSIPSTGVLPITMGDIPVGTAIKTKTLGRFQYTIPEEAGMDSKTLDKIESIATEAITMRGTPGCHVLVAKDGKVVYERSFGHLTYEKQMPVTDSTIYDLASVTKVTATLQAIMFLYDRNLIDIHKKASYYLPELKNSNKKDYTIKDILTHQAGLWPFLPFWAQTMKDSVHLPEYYSNAPSLQYPFVVAEKLYASAAMKDSLWTWIIHAKVREKPARTPYDYRYSDMGFYILQHLAEKILNQPLEDFLEQNLYEPLGAYTTGYQPLLRFPVSRIAPTENDRLFRKSLLIGTVHDQGAAMHGGTAGHAGLFSTAHDLAKLGQMLLQNGYYGGYQYYRPETIRFFTQKQFETSRRGLGWDRPVQSDWNSPTSLYASQKTFGHTGFTGTCIWIDPEFNLVYIFLSNRVHPDMTNNKLLSANIRSRIQDVLYQAIFNYCKKSDLEVLPDNSEDNNYIGGSSSQQ